LVSYLALVSGVNTLENNYIATIYLLSRGLTFITSLQESACPVFVNQNNIQTFLLEHIDKQAEFVRVIGVFETREEAINSLQEECTILLLHGFSMIGKMIDENVDD